MKCTIRRSCLAFTMAALLHPHAALADVSTTMFQDNMVLQQAMPAPVFGTAAARESVTVSFRGQTKTTRAGDDGKWQVLLDPMTPGGPFDMTITATNTLSFKNVMVGEVWLCAGQSNMGYSMKKIGGKNIEEAATANNPDIRILTMTRGKPAPWEPLTPAVSLKSSATAYWFSKNLYASLHLPIGLIVSSSPGTSIRYWVDPETAAADNGLAGTKSVGKWFNELVKPAIPYAIRGAIWYQGESDTDANAAAYQSRFLSMIQHYRAAWGEGDFPFLFVQLPHFGKVQTEADVGADSNWAQLRAAQAAALSLPNTAMAVTIDTGDKDYHPEDKWDVGKRLSLLAQHLVYGQTNVECSGPVLQSCKKNGEDVVLKFSHADGLVDRATDGKESGFAVCGADGAWHWAKPTVNGETVLLTCNDVKDPVKVRYAWADWPAATPLFNAAGLPAAPFEADVKR